jgi:hypothetical protein
MINDVWQTEQNFLQEMKECEKPAANALLGLRPAPQSGWRWTRRGKVKPPLLTNGKSLMELTDTSGTDEFSKATWYESIVRQKLKKKYYHLKSHRKH